MPKLHKPHPHYTHLEVIPASQAHTLPVTPATQHHLIPTAHRTTEYRHSTPSHLIPIACNTTSYPQHAPPPQIHTLTHHPSPPLAPSPQHLHSPHRLHCPQLPIATVRPTSSYPGRFQSAIRALTLRDGGGATGVSGGRQADWCRPTCRVRTGLAVASKGHGTRACPVLPIGPGHTRHQALPTGVIPCLAPDRGLLCIK
jgi:hypothetical protein